jgi:hypothetical protein
VAVPFATGLLAFSHDRAPLVIALAGYAQGIADQRTNAKSRQLIQRCFQITALSGSRYSGLRPPLDDGGGQNDYDMAREYLARAEFDLLQIGQLNRFRDGMGTGAHPAYRRRYGDRVAPPIDHSTRDLPRWAMMTIEF